MSINNYTINCELDKDELLALSNYYSKRSLTCMKCDLPEIAIEHEQKADFYSKEAERLTYQEEQRGNKDLLLNDCI